MWFSRPKEACTARSLRLYTLTTSSPQALEALDVCTIRVT